MTLYEYHTKHIPEYNSTMYLDGFTPYEILFAHRQSMMRRLKETQEVEDDFTEIKFNSEVKVKK